VRFTGIREELESEPNGTYLNLDVEWVSIFCVTHQPLRSNTTALFNECLTALISFIWNAQAPVIASFPRRRESSVFLAPWIPACAGMTKNPNDYLKEHSGHSQYRGNSLHL
jgi:hypothetical protein